MATAWLQRHDFSSIELGNFSPEGILAAFDGVDWQFELSQFDADSPDRSCPPGFGIKLGGNILHLCPFDTRNMFFHIHYEAPTRFLGIVPFRRKRSHYVESHPVRRAHRVISQFLETDLEPILGIK